MESFIKELPIPKEVIEVQEALPLPEPEPVSYTHLTLPTTPYV